MSYNKWFKSLITPNVIVYPITTELGKTVRIMNGISQNARTFQGAYAISQDTVQLQVEYSDEDDEKSELTYPCVFIDTSTINKQEIDSIKKKISNMISKWKKDNTYLFRQYNSASDKRGKFYKDKEGLWTSDVVNPLIEYYYFNDSSIGEFKMPIKKVVKNKMPCHQNIELPKWVDSMKELFTDDEGVVNEELIGKFLNDCSIIKKTLVDKEDDEFNKSDFVSECASIVSHIAKTIGDDEETFVEDFYEDVVELIEDEKNTKENKDEVEDEDEDNHKNTRTTHMDEKRELYDTIERQEEKIRRLEEQLQEYTN